MNAEVAETQQTLHLNPVLTQIQGILLDSPVINIGYRAATQEGTTNAQGEFNFVEGETVTFFIGDLEFPDVEATGETGT